MLCNAYQQVKKSRAEEVPVIGMKNVFSFKSLPDAEELYFIYNHLPVLYVICPSMYVDILFVCICTVSTY